MRPTGFSIAQKNTVFSSSSKKSGSVGLKRSARRNTWRLPWPPADAGRPRCLATPARRFGLASKGAIAVGRDADIVLFDPAARRTMRAADLHHTSDYTPYEGLEVAGAVRDVVLRGTDVIRGGTFVGRRGAGQFIERGSISG